jgi:outer membrane receptor protein involved in Fe transport
MWNLEAGVKSHWLDGSLVTNVAVFYAKRKDAQTKSSTQVGTSFIEFYDNAAQATHMGLEAGLDWFLTDQLRVIGSMGLLNAKFNEYQNPNPAAVMLQGRDVASAPSYQYNLGAEWYANSAWTIRANVEGKDAFYFSDSHNSKSNAYALVNASADYRYDPHWRVSIWARNLLDKDYATRGFFFDLSGGTNPQAYQQYGEPRVAGLTVTYDY